MTASTGRGSSRRAAPKPEEFTEQTRECQKCGVVKPLDDEHFKTTSSGRVYGFRKVCRKCMATDQRLERETTIESEVDLLSRQDLREGIWTRRDIQPRGDVPLRRDWDLLCGMCGELWVLRMSDDQAHAFAVRITVQRVRCGKCRGWVSLATAFSTLGGSIELMPQSPDALDGPKRIGVPRWSKGSAA